MHHLYKQLCFTSLSSDVFMINCNVNNRFLRQFTLNVEVAIFLVFNVTSYLKTAYYHCSVFYIIFNLYLFIRIYITHLFIVDLDNPTACYSILSKTKYFYFLTPCSRIVCSIQYFFHYIQNLQFYYVL